jgi:hypothetical protein
MYCGPGPASSHRKKRTTCWMLWTGEDRQGRLNLMRRPLLVCLLITLGLWLHDSSTLQAQCTVCDLTGSQEASCISTGGNWDPSLCSCSVSCDQSGASYCYLQNGSWNSATCTCALPPPPSCSVHLEYGYYTVSTTECIGLNDPLNSVGSLYQCNDNYEYSREVDCNGNIVPGTEVDTELGTNCVWTGDSCN